MGTGAFPGVKRPGRDVDQLPHLAPRLKKEYSYISTPCPCLHGRVYDALYLYIYIYIFITQERDRKI